MAQPQPHLLTKGELRRVEDCVNENVKLADCWKSEKVVIVACEPTGPDLPGMPLIDLDILSPAGNPVWGSKTGERHPTRQICKKIITVLEKTKENKRLRPRPWHGMYDCREEFSLYHDDAVAKVREIFSELYSQYVSICVVSHDLRDSLNSIEKFGIELPDSTVFVDLIKVLEHQSRQSEKGTPEELKKYTDDNVAIRNGRYDRRPWPLTGQFGMPNMALLEVLGPAAESHRRDKTEKRDAAMKRIARRMAVEDIPVRNKGRS
ncbi:uncharacterized protein J7T55_003879 [Diaporthe amygdali]|uniref:uncharacterized protein n=1 Tax=Phomopsis amygdali TaxID=1214568 RepID=UPI0022FE5521|nr:uncharacterized protein J7T55_003879 [Diaporthe amygdali]KAJ0117463.1 uncharacterized protein J7T55_003879 [Diaporthe amygdali]